MVRHHGAAGSEPDSRCAARRAARGGRPPGAAVSPSAATRAPPPTRWRGRACDAEASSSTPTGRRRRVARGQPVEPGPAAAIVLVRDRPGHPHGRARPARPRRRAAPSGRARRMARRIPRRAGRADLRRDERDRRDLDTAAARAARAERAMDFAFLRGRRSCAECARSSTRSAPGPRCVRSNGPTRPRRAPESLGLMAELGAPALAVPAAATVSAWATIDLVGVLEEAGWACLPEALLETAALAAPTWPPSCRSRRGRPPRRRWSKTTWRRRRRHRRDRGRGRLADAGVGDGTLAPPRRRRTRRRAVPAPGLPGRRVGLALHVVPAASCTRRATPALSDPRSDDGALASRLGDAAGVRRGGRGRGGVPRRPGRGW